MGDCVVITPTPPPAVLNLYSIYHLPWETAIVLLAGVKAVPLGAVKSKLPSAKVGDVVWVSIELNVAKLLVGVSSVTSVAARFDTAKCLSLPDVSAPIPLELVLVPVCLNSNLKPLRPKVPVYLFGIQTPLSLVSPKEVGVNACPSIKCASDIYPSRNSLLLRCPMSKL